MMSPLSIGLWAATYNRNQQNMSISQTWLVEGSNTQGQRSVINVAYYTALHNVENNEVQSQYQQTVIHTEKKFID